MTVLFLYLFCCVFIQCSANLSEEDEKDFNNTQIKINGKTYFFQLRKDTIGNDTTYKRVKDYLNTLERVDEVELITHEGNKKQRVSAFENLKNERRNYLKMEQSSYIYSSQFLDDEWKYNLNNQYTEIPDIAHKFYKSMAENSNKQRNVTLIRFLFETLTNADGVVKFDLSTLKNKTNDTLIDVELHVYKMPENNETENEGKYSSDQVVRLYQILPINDTEDASQNPDIHKLLNVIYVSSQYSGWQVFKVKNVVENWLRGDENNGFLLSATDTWENDMPINIGHRYDGKYQPILITYFNTPIRRETTTSSSLAPLSKPAEKYINFSKNSNILPSNPMPCSRHVWYVSFQELGWNNFIIAPSGFMAFKCKGSCMSQQISPFTNHGRLVNAYHVSFSYQKRPCCVPDTFKTVPIMYYDKYQNVVIKTYDDMIVENCACR